MHVYWKHNDSPWLYTNRIISSVKTINRLHLIFWVHLRETEYIQKHQWLDSQFISKTHITNIHERTEQNSIRKILKTLQKFDERQPKQKLPIQPNNHQQSLFLWVWTEWNIQ